MNLIRSLSYTYKASMKTEEMENGRNKWSEEFQEEDIWGAPNQTEDSSDSWTACNNTSFKHSKRTPTMKIPKSEKNSRAMSAPVNAPADWSKITSSKKPCSWLDDDGDVDVEEIDNKNNNNVMMIPPHELIAKNQTSSFSVIEGAGRTLKGRDLMRVRYEALTKTGFLEPTSHDSPHYPF